MSEMKVSIDNAVALDDTSSNPLFITSVTNPAIKGAYVFSIGDVPGVAAANNFVSLFNPVGSGKNISVGAAYVSSYCNAASNPTVPVNGFRITAASGGTLQTNSTAVAQFQTAMPTSIAEIRIGNPTVTAGAQIFNAPPAISNSGANSGTSTSQIIAAAPSVYPPFVLVPGEGIVLRQTAAGVTTTMWNFSLVWAEL